MPVANLAKSQTVRPFAQWAESTAYCHPAALPPGAPADLRAFWTAIATSPDLTVHLGVTLICTCMRWPDLSELKLFWLCARVSTAGLERGLLFQTLIDQDMQRCRTTYELMRKTHVGEWLLIV